MRSIWKGAISFGLVNIPVEVYSAISGGGERVSFKQLHKKDLSPIKNVRYCAKEDKPIAWEDVVKGYEYTKGKFIVMEDEDFRAATIESTKSVDLQEFVKESEVDPRFFETPYYLLPQKGGEKAYALLREAIRKTGMIGIGTVTMRSNSIHLVGIKVIEDALVMEIMRYGDELVDTSSFTFPAADAVRPAELQMAEQLVATMVDSFKPEKYSDAYKDKLMEIINAKLKGKKIEVEEPEEPEATNVLDLMARLQASLTEGKKPKADKKADKGADKEADREADREADKKPASAKKTAKKRRKTA